MDLLEKLINVYIESTNICPSDIDLEETEDCSIDCDTCRKQSIEKFLKSK